MTGPEHYTEAEKHLAWAAQNEDGSNRQRYNLAAAQVHAILAFTAEAQTGQGDEVERLRNKVAKLRSTVWAVRVIARHGDMSAVTRQELADALADVEEDGDA